MQAVQMFDVDKEMSWYRLDRADIKATKGTKNFNIGKPFNKLTMDGRFIKSYRSVAEAAAIVKVHHCCIYKCLRGETHSAGGYKWEYA